MLEYWNAGIKINAGMILCEKDEKYWMDGRVDGKLDI